MTTFQLITLPLLVLMVVATAVAIHRRKLAPRLGFFWLIVWLAGGTFVAFPDLASLLANFLGIGRGADLVLYLSILFMFGAFFSVYLRFRRLEEQITQLVRHLAIRDADDPRKGELSR
jgi:small membrane protein